MKDYQTGRLDTCIAIYAIKHHFINLEDHEFNIAFEQITKNSDFHFVSKRRKLPPDDFSLCPLCNNKIDEYHYCKCSAIAYTKKSQHDADCNAIMRILKKKYTVAEC